MAKTLRENRINRITYISLGGVAIAIIAIIIVINIVSNKGKDDNVQIGNSISKIDEIDEKFQVSEIIDDTEEANSSIGKNVEESKKDDTLVDGNLGDELNQTEENIPQIQTAANQESTEVELKEQISETANVEQEKDPIFMIPVDGEIIKHYGKEKLIYSETLKEWTTHTGIDINADKTTVVKAAADGTVKSIKNDPRYGLTVVLEHSNGFTTVYSNLLTAEFVSQGETVKAGQTLGTVGNSATFEILDDSHLHFEILKDGNSIDPEMYIK